jgi:hypothetical protein
MSKRRQVGDVVVVQDADEGPYLCRIDALGSEPRNGCLRCLDINHDQCCREWPNLEILDPDGRSTGEWACHVTECEMQDPP